MDDLVEVPSRTRLILVLAMRGISRVNAAKGIPQQHLLNFSV